MTWCVVTTLLAQNRAHAFSVACGGIAAGSSVYPTRASIPQTTDTKHCSATPSRTSPPWRSVPNPGVPDHHRCPRRTFELVVTRRPFALQAPTEDHGLGGIEKSGISRAS